MNQVVTIFFAEDMPKHITRTLSSTKVTKGQHLNFWPSFFNIEKIYICLPENWS